MLLNQCPCAGEVTVNALPIEAAANQPPPSCEVAASATIVIQEPESVRARLRSYRADGVAGTVPAGVRSISFLNDGQLDALVNGEILRPGTSLMYPVLGGNATYEAIEYDATNTTLRIDCTMWGAGAPYLWPTG